MPATLELAELVKRIDRLESIQQITLLHNEYVRALAARDWAVVADLYTEDALCDIRNHGVHVGREAILKMFDDELRNVVTTRDGYILSSPSITVDEDGDRAEGTWTWHRFQSDFKTSLGRVRVWGPWSEGKYVTKYTRVDGVWKISELWFRVYAPDSDEEIALASEQDVVLGGVRRVNANSTASNT